MNKSIQNINIRPETSEDVLSIRHLLEHAFGRNNEARLVELLRESHAFVPELSLVAEVQEKIVGHIFFSRIKITEQTRPGFMSLALAPLAVWPEFQNRGIGSLLTNFSLQKARELGHTSVIVLGHKTYYPRFGFKPAAGWNILAPFETKEGSFMALELLPGALTDISGTVEYAGEFAMV